MDGKRLELKIQAFFHDPPWKAWNLVFKQTFIAKKRGHEKDSLELISRLLNKEVKDLDEVVKSADILASTIDRWIITALYSPDRKGQRNVTNKGRQNVLPVIDYKMNIFSPWAEFESNSCITIDRMKILVNEYVDELVCLARHAGDLVYHVVYFLAQALWYEKFPYAVPLADTRVPTHTVFDHATATAALTNVITCDEKKLRFEGSMALLEFPSVHEFLYYSKKTRDLWASSWIISALLWWSVAEFVEKYGPDVVLRPELSLNHFYLAWLINKIPPSKRRLKKRIVELARKYASLKGNPTISMMSDKVVLILPKDKGIDNVDEVERRLTERFREGWEKIAEKVLLDELKRFETVGLDAKAVKIKEYLDKAIKRPPVDPVVRVIDLSKAYNEFRERLNPPELECESLPGEQRYLLLFEYFYHKLRDGVRLIRSYGSGLVVNDSSSSTASDVLSRLTQEDYEVCTVCGILPSVFYYYSDKDRITPRKVSDDYDDRLCPYCTVKRFLENHFVEVLDSLGLKVDDARTRFPSTPELALKDYERALREKFVRHDVELGPQDAERLANCLMKPCDTRELEQKGKYDRELLKKYGSLYFAVIKADGDMVGEGVWSGALKKADGHSMDVMEYIEEIVKYISYYDKDLAKEVWDSAKQLISSAILLDARRNLGIKRNAQNDNAVPVPLTPTYAYAISRALTVQAVMDKELIESAGGYPVYLGGDDLLALSPVVLDGKLVPLEIVRRTRESYWTFSDDIGYESDGFKAFSGMVVDSLRPYGRSYAVFIAHYKDPLTLSLDYANYLLDLKDNVEGKDVLFVSYGRGVGRPDYAVVRMSELAPRNQNEPYKMRFEAIDLMARTYEAIERENLSKNVLHDFAQIYDYARVNPGEGSAMGQGPAQTRDSKGNKVFRNLAKRTLQRNSRDEKFAGELLKGVEGMVGTPPCQDRRGAEGGVCEGREWLTEVMKAVGFMIRR